MKFWQHDEHGNLTTTGGQLRAARRWLGLDYEQMASLLNLRMRKPENRRRAIVRLETGAEIRFGGALVATLVLAVEGSPRSRRRPGRFDRVGGLERLRFPEPKPTPKPAPTPDDQPPAVSDDPEERREAEAERVRQRLRRG